MKVLLKFKNIDIIQSCKSLLVIMFFCVAQLFSQSIERPLIWVKNSDKEKILKNISENPQIHQYFDEFKTRADKETENYFLDKKKYLSLLPLNWKDQKLNNIPPILKINNESDDSVSMSLLTQYLQTAIDCGILYYLLDEEKYAQYASDILYTIVESLVQIEPSTSSNGGWIYSDNHLYEARQIGAQIPIVYDFVQPYLIKNKQVYNFAKNDMVAFNFENAQKVFRTYIDLAINHGIINCNWPLLEASSLVGNTLALDSVEEQNNYLRYFLTENTPHQDALLKVSNHYIENNGNWPESFNYSGGVNGYLTYLMTMLTKLNPSLHLGKEHLHILKALPENYYFTYPNATETILFGDGHREYHPNFEGFEMAYYLGTLENSKEIENIFGPLINSSVKSGIYKRFQLEERSLGASVYQEPLKILWFVPEISGEIKDYPLPTTDELPFVGILLQRNISATEKPEDAFMTYVGGGHHVHGHATGMFMELYGKGYVLGSRGGRSKYRSEIHENYYRLFASNNTVVVNGASQSEGGWANLEINRVQKVAMEPQPKKEAVSPNNSFITASFLDDKSDGAEATQQRTMGIIRTSPNTGYYLDVFRSKSKLPNEFHDYIYHNIGDLLELENGKEEKISLKLDPYRYKASENKEWVKNKKARHPGWHYFKNVKTSGIYKNPITALFTAKSLESNPIHMRLFTNSTATREYTSVDAPPTTEGPNVYQKKPTPTLVIRQQGDAWKKPFAVIYEPYKLDESSIVSVKEINQNNDFKGFTVISKVDSKIISQLIIVQENENSEYIDTTLNFSFTGRYCVITLNSEKNLQSVYIGSGKKLSIKDLEIVSDNLMPFAVNIDFDTNLVINANKKLTIKRVGKGDIDYVPD